MSRIREFFFFEGLGFHKISLFFETPNNINFQLQPYETNDRDSLALNPTKQRVFRKQVQASTELER